jgi:hypothetical protein
MPEKNKVEPIAVNEVAPEYMAQSNGIDLALLKDNLSKTVSQRMKANDDAANFAEALREGMKKRNAKPV